MTHQILQSNGLGSLGCLVATELGKNEAES